ncbi:hypothetical protein KIF24_25500 [Micromonospora sp. Llam7]|uniref:hypothetical protein n=1 Tax=Micromonospora tarapacensis TaxID=2835305 RepID=UPI001C835F23|nr:hypothetical protein [Micromonospora tarapacensis]MBX7269051.1 hypothetical protein [Micromonospora tarapacensis]
MTLVETLGVVVPTPPEHRTWIPEVEALDTLRCTGEELEQLVAAGLVRDGGRYENYDVWNLGLLSGSGRSRPEREMVFFARVLKSFGADWVSRRRYEITGWAECPRAEDCPSRDWVAPALPDVVWEQEQIQPGRAEWRGQVVSSGMHATVRDPRVRDAWNHLLEQYRFHFTPASLSPDMASTLRRRVGDCEALCRVLLRDLLDLGIPTELEPGYIFGGARLRRHAWLRFADSDGQSKVLDPSMALLAEMFFTPEYKEFCFGSSINRVIRRDSGKEAFVTHPCVTGDNKIYYEFILRPIRSAQESGITAS